MLAPLLLAATLVSPAPLAPTPAAPVVTAPASRGGKVEDVEIETRDKQELAGSYYSPKDDKGLAPAVLLIHDAGGSRAQTTALAERLHKIGFAVLAFDLRNHGESKTGAKQWDAMDEEEREKTWTFATRDLEAAAQWLSRRPEVHSTNLSLVGLRAGSTLAVRHATKDQNVMAVVLVAPQSQQLGFDLESEIEELEGLPTCILAKRDEAKAAEAISARGNSTGDPFIEVITSRADNQDAGIDKKQAIEITKWLKAQAMPKKGGR